MRNDETDADLLASDPDLASPVASVSVKVITTGYYTYIEVWQGGPDFSPAGTRVWFKRYARHSKGVPDQMMLAAWLARETSAMDREGWSQLRS